MDNLLELKNLLSEPTDIALTAHRNPDGDAMGSTLGMYHYLTQLGHRVEMVFPSEYPATFDYMPGADQVVIFDVDPEKTKEVLSNSSIIFCLDFNALERIDKVGEIIRPLSTKTVMIDHHLYPSDFADFMLSDPTASSTCELVYDFMVMMGHEDLINKTLGECLYTGILTDTGSFKYATSPKLFGIVSRLLDKGVDDYFLQDAIFNSMNEKQLRLLGHCLYNRMEILPEFQTGIIALSRRDYERYDIQRGDTEGVVNYLLKVKSVKVAALITEQPTIVKISLRSKGDISVQEIAQKHFKGGGHKNASGGSSYKGLRSTVEKFKSILPEYKDILAPA